MVDGNLTLEIERMSSNFVLGLEHITLYVTK